MGDETVQGLDDVKILVVKEKARHAKKEADSRRKI